MTEKPKRFQMLLFDWFDITARAAERNGNTLTAECRHRIARSFWLDELEAYIKQEAVHARGDRLATLQELIEFISKTKKEIVACTTSTSPE
jgi:hypothetical protein